MTTKAILNPLPSEPEAFEAMVLDLLMKAGRGPVESSREGRGLEIKIGKRTFFFGYHGAWNGRDRRRDEWHPIDSPSDLAEFLGVDLRHIELDAWLDRRQAVCVGKVQLEAWRMGNGIVMVQRLKPNRSGHGGGFELFTSDGTSTKIVDAFYDAERRVGLRPEVPSDDLPMTPAHVEDNLLPEVWERTKGQLDQLLPFTEWDAIDSDSLDLRVLTQDELDTVATWCLAVSGDAPHEVRPMPVTLIALALVCAKADLGFGLGHGGQHWHADAAPALREDVTKIAAEFRSRLACE